MNEKEFKKYEIGFLVRAEEDREEIIKILKNYQAAIIDDGKISRMKLAYPIKKESFAYFGYLHFSCIPESLKELRNEFKNSPKILRFIIISQPAPVKKDEIKDVSKEDFPRAASPMIKKVKETTKQFETLSNEDLEKKLEEILK